MLSRYKIELFERDYSFRSFAPIENPQIFFDYLTMEKTTVNTIAISAEKGDFAHITDGAGKVIYQGIVDDVETDKNGVKLSLKPLMSIFDTEVYFDRSTSSQVEPFIASVISQNFISSSDPLQNITGLSVETTSNTTGALNLKDNIHNLFEIIVTALTGYGITVKMLFDPEEKTISCTIGKVSGSEIIEAGLKGIAEKNIIVGESYGEINKLLIVNKKNESQQVTYYLHPNGTISTDDSDRITPVFFRADFLEQEDDTTQTFAEAAYSKAYEALAPQKYDNLVELTVPADSAVVNTSMAVGTLVTILDGETALETVLTGFERDGDVVKMVFGCVRASLTKKLILERRKKN